MSTTMNSGALFHVIRRESGQSSHNLPIFAATPQAAANLLDGVKEEAGNGNNNNTAVCHDAPLVKREDYEDSVFVLHNVLSKDECQRIIKLSEQMGYTEDAPVSLGRNIRKNENCVWIMDDLVNRVVFERAKDLLPQAINFHSFDLGEPIGLNRRWRLYRYHPTDVFKMHTDGGWTGSGINAKGNYVQDMFNGTAFSWLTFLVYLSDDFDGGSTAFRRPRRHRQPFGGTNEEEEDIFHVPPKQGSVLCFFHGYHPLSPLHEGSLVTKGTKYVARTDVLYALPRELQKAFY